MTSRSTVSTHARRELAAFLRSHRERLRSERVSTTRRRTPGLRREEVAERAGMSTTWYTWLEQGRDVSLSALALARLARALQLSSAERRYIFELAQRRDPEQQDDPAPSAVVLTAVHAISGPTYVLDRQFTAVAWNAAAARLFTGWLDARSQERNLLRYMFLTPSARSLVHDWPHRAARLVAEFRAHCGPHTRDTPTARLIAELEGGSAEFRKLWGAAEVVERHGGQRTFRRGARAVVTYEQLTLSPAIAPGFLFVMLLLVRKRRQSIKRDQSSIDSSR
jgi:transcriptional regulator with XRE-family HTH domain